MNLLVAGELVTVEAVKLEIRLSCGSEIDDRNSQYGDNLSPGVEFVDVPGDAESLVLFMEDLNASETRRVHWVIWNIPPEKNLPEGIARGGEVDGLDALQGNNDFDVMGYTGPEYPPGNETYRFTAYALQNRLNLDAGATMVEVRQEMREEKVLDKAVVEAGYTN